MRELQGQGSHLPLPMNEQYVQIKTGQDIQNLNYVQEKQQPKN
jgi:hypothetical protein